MENKFKIGDLVEVLSRPYHRIDPDTKQISRNYDNICNITRNTVGIIVFIEEKEEFDYIVILPTLEFLRIPESWMIAF